MFVIIKAVSCFDLSLVNFPEVRSRSLKSLLTILSDINWISGIEADEMKSNLWSFTIDISN